MAKGKLIHFKEDTDEVSEKVKELQRKRHKLIQNYHCILLERILKIRKWVVKKEKIKMVHKLNAIRKRWLIEELSAVTQAWLRIRLTLTAVNVFDDEDLSFIIKIFKKSFKLIYKELKEVYDIPVISSEQNIKLRKEFDKMATRLAKYINKIKLSGVLDKNEKM